MVDLLFVIATMALLTGILMPALADVRLKSARMACGANLSDLGRAMLIYANDYDNDFPRAGFAMTPWAGKIVSWTGGPTHDRLGAYGGNPGQATITSSFYLLVKYAEVTTESFVCEGQPTVTVFKASDQLANMEDEDAWDFGDCDGNTKYPTNHCSYSYHLPYTRFFLSTATSEPGMAVAADQNPFLDYSTLPSSRDFIWDNHEPAPAPNNDIKIYQLGNSGAHEREGQNVLFMDIHVDFEKQSFCAINDDNIYTYQAPAIAIQQGAQPVCETYNIQPTTSKDSLLVNECGYLTGTMTDTTLTTAPTKPPPCFTADALVWVDGKLVQISQAVPGQKVGKLDSASPAACLAVAPSLKAIEEIEEHPANQFGAGDCYDIMLESGNSITVVYSHFVLTDAGQWVDVRDLTSGSKLMSINGPITVTSVVKRATSFVGTSYNLKIKGAERYFVGKDGIVARDW